jgi:CRISPR-associated protein Csd2
MNSTDLNSFDPDRRHDFVLLFDAQNSNPNGDPNDANRPRQDDRTKEGIVRDAAIKRKVRDWMDEKGKTVLVKRGDESLEALVQEHYDDSREAPLEEACIDVRLFGNGPVQNAPDDYREIWGPVQINNAVSVDPIEPIEEGLTRSLPTGEGDDNTGMGRRWIVPYGLYRACGSYAPSRASDHVSEEDLKLLYQGLLRGWEHSQSSARSGTHGHLLAVVTHEHRLGNAPRRHPSKQGTWDIVQAESTTENPRSVDDYNLSVDDPPDETKLTTFEPYGELS